jgi:hypothetical protein
MSPSIVILPGNEIRWRPTRKPEVSLRWLEDETLC